MTGRALPICLVTGPSGSGKTTLIEGLVRELARRGIPVATVKHHRGRVPVDRPGKDTWRHRRAGARATFFVTADELVMFADRPAGLDPADLVPLCPPDVRLLLVEGFKDLRGYPRIEVVRKPLLREIAWDSEVLCVATDVADFRVPVPVYSLDDAAGIAGLLVSRLLSSAT